ARRCGLGARHERRVRRRRDEVPAVQATRRRGVGMSADPDARTDVGVDPETEAEMRAEIDPDVDISTANTMRERANESRIKLWVMLGANRLLITALLALFVFVAFVALGVFVYPPFEASLRSADIIETMFSTMIGA